MNGYRRRGISFGTVFMLLLTIIVAGSCAVVLPKLAGNMDQRFDAQQLADAITGSLDLPALTLSDIPIFPSQADGEDTSEVAQGGTPLDTAANNQSAVVSTPEPFATKPLEKRALTLTVTGTLAFDGGIRKSGYNSESKTYDFSRIFSVISSEFQGDISLATLENTLVTDGKLTEINTTKDVLKDISVTGLDMLSLGHEHILDLGLAGLQETAAAVRAAGFSVLGIKTDNQDTQNPLIMDMQGVRIAFLHYSELISSAGKKAAKTDDCAYALPAYQPEAVSADIQSARAQGAQVVIVMMHWGTDEQTKVTSAMKEKAQFIANAGADMIFGAHGKTALAIEYLTGTRTDGTNRPTLVCYSLGGLLTSSRDTAHIAGMILNLQIGFDSAIGMVSFDKVEYVPTYIWRTKENGQYVYQVLASDQLSPDSMDAAQKGVMQRALERISKLLADSPAKPRTSAPE